MTSTRLDLIRFRCIKAQRGWSANIFTCSLAENPSILFTFVAKLYLLPSHFFVALLSLFRWGWTSFCIPFVCIYDIHSPTEGRQCQLQRFWSGAPCRLLFVSLPTMTLHLHRCCWQIESIEVYPNDDDVLAKLFFSAAKITF